jgi:hypothetical protein
MEQRIRKIVPVVNKFSADEQPKERAYWTTRAPIERLAALEAIRREHHGEEESQRRLQRVYRLVNENEARHLSTGGFMETTTQPNSECNTTFCCRVSVASCRPSQE